VGNKSIVSNTTYNVIKNMVSKYNEGLFVMSDYIIDTSITTILLNSDKNNVSLKDVKKYWRYYEEKC